MRRLVGSIAVVGCAAALLAPHMRAQQPNAQIGQQPNAQIGDQPLQNATVGQPQLTPNPMEQIRANYVLGTNDQILVRAFQVEEIGERPYRVDTDGNIDLPLVGIVRAAGLSVDQLEAELNKRLATFVRNPQVSVTVVQYRSEPVFLMGMFRSPGIYPLQGKRTLVDMVSTVGGFQPNASRRMVITRRLEYGPLPLPNAVINKTTNTSRAEISMGSLKDNLNPAEDIVLQPYDQIFVARAEMIYLGGEVSHQGGFELGERDSLSILQAISLAGGLSREADQEKARILRPILDTNKRAEIPVNLKRILAGKNPDFPLMANDLLYVPRGKSVGKTLGRTAIYWAPGLVSTILYLATR